MKKIISALALCLFLITSCEIPEPAVTTGSIVGVIYADDSPLNGVTVEISPGGNSYISKSGGSYSFLDLTAGQYTIKFTKKGYLFQSKTLSVNAGSETRGDVTLEIDPNALKVSTDILDFSTSFNNLSIALDNNGPTPVQWSASIKDNPSWISLSNDSGTLQINGKTDISLSVDRSKVVGEKASTSLAISSSLGQVLNVNISVTAGKAASATVSFGDISTSGFAFNVTVTENTKGFYAAVNESDSMTADELVKTGMYQQVEKGKLTYRLEATGKVNTKYYIHILPINEYGQRGEIVRPYITIPDADTVKPTAEITVVEVGSTSFKFKLKLSQNTTAFYAAVFDTPNFGPAQLASEEYLIECGGKYDWEFELIDKIGNLEIKPNITYYVAVIPVNVSNLQGDMVKKSVTTSSINVEDYLGYWDLSGVGLYYSDPEWERIEIFAIEGEDGYVGLCGLYGGEGCVWDSAIGVFDEERKMINILGGWSFENNSYTYTDDPDKISYYSIFSPVYVDEATESVYYIQNENDDDVEIASLSLENGVIRLVGGPKADKNGRYANGFVFDEYKTEDNSYSGSSDVIYDVTMTRSANQNAPSSIKAIKKKAIEKANYLNKTTYQISKTQNRHRNEKIR